jgi:hypothetical protein
MRYALAALALAGSLLAPRATQAADRTDQELEAEVEKLVDDQAQAVAACVHKQLDTANRKATVVASLVINNRGQLAGNKVTISDLAAARKKAAEGCVKDLFKALKWPTGKKPVIEVTRTWRFNLG